MPIFQQKKQNFPLKIVGSTVFGRYPKISKEETFNMIISDGWLVPYAGYKKITDILPNGESRGLFYSVPLNKLIIVIDNEIYFVSTNENFELRATIDSYVGDVFIDENDAGQIAICDKKDIYILDYKNNVFQKAETSGSQPLDFLPVYITFQNGYFISADSKSPQWRLSELNNGLVFPAEAAYVGTFQSKPDLPKAAIRIPGKGNQLFVIGSTVTELWTDVGYDLFPYQRTTAFNIDYGCINQSTIAASDNFIIWLGINEKSGPTIIYSSGGSVKQISNDGINFKLAQLTAPEDSYGFLFKQDGHLIYQLTFKTDNLTYIFDFNTNAFFTLSDENANHHIAKRVAYFNNKYYFISFDDGNLYEMNSIYTDYDGKEIPRTRICPNIRLPDSSPFIVNSIGFPLEQGKGKQKQVIDLSISNDGGEMFGNTRRSELRSLGNRKNRYKEWGLGRTNDFVPKFKFWGFDRVVASDGVVEVYR